ncbi:hypothetical protein PAPHI01_0777 [Pancytospora philotis]|nr:hypothetical protein PAPHI01_0777 [Pancytospora philotis]
MYISLWSAVLLLLFLFSGCDLHAVSQHDSAHDSRRWSSKHPPSYDVYAHEEGSGRLMYEDRYVHEYDMPGKKDDLEKNLQACFRPSQRHGYSTSPKAVTFKDLNQTCTQSYYWRIKDKEVGSGRSAVIDDSTLDDVKTSLLLILVGAAYDEKLNEALMKATEFQQSQFGEVLEARFRSVVGNPKLAYDDGSDYTKSLYSYYFEDPQFTTFLKAMERSDSLNARRFISVDDYYQLGEVVGAKADYSSLSQEMKLKWTKLVFSKFALRLYALRDAYFMIVPMWGSDRRTAEDLAEDLHAYFIEVYESNGSKEIAGPVAAVYTLFDLFELAYVQCTGATPYIVESRGARASAARLDLVFSHKTASFIKDMLTIAMAWVNLPDRKITERTLTDAEQDISEFYERNIGRLHGNCE